MVITFCIFLALRHPPAIPATIPITIPAGTANGAITFTGSGGLLRIDGSALTSVPIAGFSLGDSIDLANIAADRATYANGALTLLNGFTSCSKPTT